MKKSGQTGRNDSNGTKKNTTTGNTSTSIYSPQTGDTTDLSGYVITLIASVIVITGWLIANLKKEENGIKKMTSTPVDLPQEFFRINRDIWQALTIKVGTSFLTFFQKQLT